MAGKTDGELQPNQNANGMLIEKCKIQKKDFKCIKMLAVTFLSMK